jgi:hypothetical protein
MRNLSRLVLLAAVVVGLTDWSNAAAAPRQIDWRAVLSTAQGKLPEPLPGVVWRDDLLKALADAKAQNRPLFVTLRCLPCKQCSAFDKDVLEGGSQLTPLLRQFITVRLTDAKAMDLRLLPVEGFQDLDLSWWGYFLSPEGRVYGVFGGKDHVSDATRISPAALAATLTRVLAHHYDPRRSAWDIDGPAVELAGAPRNATNLAGYESWFSRGGKEVKAQVCIHCHQVSEILRQPALDAGKFDKLRDTQIWPLPENVGIALDRDDGLLVKSIDPGSPAERAGLRAGDSLAAAGDRRLFGQADFRGVLHRGPAGDGVIPIYWLRNGQVMDGRLQVAGEWRKTVLGWRMSLAQGNIGIDCGFFPLTMSKNERLKVNLADDAMGVKPFMYKEATPASQAGLKSGHFIVAVNGQSPNISGRAFEWWFRERFEVGDAVTLDVVDAQGTRSQIKFQLARNP